MAKATGSRKPGSASTGNCVPEKGVTRKLLTSTRVLASLENQDQGG